MAYSEILTEEIAEGAPLDNTTLTKVKDNFSYLKALVGGGGGGALEFSLNESPAPLPEVYDGHSVLKFANDVNAKTKLSVKVPSGYQGGVIPKLKLAFFSPNSTSGLNVSLKASTELIENNEAFDNNSGNFDKTISAEDSSVANAIVKTEIDLANTNGVINGVAIEANDILDITLQRLSSDTLNEDIFIVPSLTSIEFTS